MRFINVSLILTAIFSLGLTACNEDNSKNNTQTPCLQISSDTLKLMGPITPEMESCALELLTPTIRKVVVNSTGGDVDVGRAIGYRIGEQSRTVIVETYCLSSCGNYFIPPAHSVKLQKGAVIGLHGSPDPHMLSTHNLETHLASLDINKSISSPSAKRQLQRKQEQRDHQLAEEARFASKFNVPKGWRLYRNQNDLEDGWRKHFEDRTDKDVVPDRFMIVEEAMMASCLPHVKTLEFQGTLEQNAFQNRSWKKLKSKIGAYRSYGLKCRANNED